MDEQDWTYRHKFLDDPVPRYLPLGFGGIWPVQDVRPMTKDELELRKLGDDVFPK